ncbi:MAG: TonB-dependent receptor plug domain-containing protein [Lacibacter sp.]
MRCILFATCILSVTLAFGQVTPSKKVSNPPVPAPQRVLDGHMILQNCSVKITTDGFTATTFMELEFYNPLYSEMEGVYRFELKDEQVITAFQLDLNGSYRDGSIEERWKATNAYNRIVGKRVDPSLLTKEYANHYCLRIYPIPSKQTRKVTITISQLLNVNGSRQEYHLPMSCIDTTKNFRLSVFSFNQKALPFFKMDVMNLGVFQQTENGFTAAAQKHSVVLNKPISFVLPLNADVSYCTKQTVMQTFFALKYHPAADSVYEIHPSSLHVFWDVSSSGARRDVKKEIGFLKQYIAWHRVQKLTIISFNYKVKDTVVFDLTKARKNGWENYLEEQEYAGATKLGVLDFSSASSDILFIFSDGKNSLGKKLPVKGTKLIYAVYAADVADTAYLNNMIGSGGRIIKLNRLSAMNAVHFASFAENRLIAVTSSSGRTIIEQQFPLRLKDKIVLNGTIASVTDTLLFTYGNNNMISSQEKIMIGKENNSVNSSIDRMDMLELYPKLQQKYYWNELLDYGLRERIVTENTAYIVLERMEDYIRYNIDVPKDLEEESLKLGYRKIDTREARKRMMMNSKEIILSNIINEYNRRISMWDKNEAPLKYLPYEKPVVNNVESEDVNTVHTNTGSPVLQTLAGKMAGVSITSATRLDEVVVVGYGSATKRSLTYSVSHLTQRDLLSSYRTVEEAMVGKVPGMQVTGAGQPGSTATISIRGSASVSSSNKPLFILDGVPVEGNINDVINVNDIESITVLRDANAAAIYGSRASAGAIVIVSKKGKYYSYNYYHNRKYKLNDMDDVEYLQEIKSVPLKEKFFFYERLRAVHANEKGFYFDMAQHFYESGLREKAIEILMEAAENADGSYYASRTIGFFLESWKEFDRAAEIYGSLLEEFPEMLQVYRDLAWAYYQSGKYQQAIDVLYDGILKDFGTDEQYHLRMKNSMLNELNAMIAIHRKLVNISQINPSLLKNLPCDLRITADDNLESNISLSVNEPGNSTCSIYGTASKNGGYISPASNQFNYYYQRGTVEYQLKHAVTGKYKLNVHYYGGWHYGKGIPSVIRVCVFRNFGKSNQLVEVENIIMDNQYGEIEIKEVKW